MKDKSLDEIITNFNVAEPESQAPLKSGGTVTIWLHKEHKAQYDRIQVLSRGQFCKVVRKLMIAAMDRIEMKAS